MPTVPTLYRVQTEKSTLVPDHIQEKPRQTDKNRFDQKRRLIKAFFFIQN
jgi:hypothetical protein